MMRALTFEASYTHRRRRHQDRAKLWRELCPAEPSRLNPARLPLQRVEDNPHKRPMST
jgi:hypothetical protein